LDEYVLTRLCFTACSQRSDEAFLLLVQPSFPPWFKPLDTPLGITFHFKVTGFSEQIVIIYFCCLIADSG